MNTGFVFIVLSVVSLCCVDSLPTIRDAIFTRYDACQEQCGINAHCYDSEYWVAAYICRCDGGFFGRPTKHCVGRSDNDLIRKMYLGYLDSNPPSDTCPMGSDTDIVSLPQCTMRDILSSLYGCWQGYADGFPYGSNKKLCTEKVAGVVSCVAKLGVRCLGSSCHNDAFIFGLIYNDDDQRKTERQWQDAINWLKPYLESLVDVTYDQLILILYLMDEKSWMNYPDGLKRLDEMIQAHSCPDLGEVPSLYKWFNKFQIPISGRQEEKYCKRGIAEKMQEIGKEMTDKWFTSKSKDEIKKAYETFKKKTTETFLTHCSNVTKVHEAFYNQYHYLPFGPYDHTKELAISLTWKLYLVATDFMVKYFYPESDIYDESLWNSANSFLEKNVVSGEIENFLAKTEDEDNVVINEDEI